MTNRTLKHPDRWNCLVRDDDCHWYIIAESQVDEFYEWESAMENCTPWSGHDFNQDRIDGPDNLLFRGYVDMSRT